MELASPPRPCDGLAAVTERLQDIGYGPESVAIALGALRPRDISMRLWLGHVHGGVPADLTDAIRFLLFRQPMPIDDLRRWLGERPLDALVRARFAIEGEHGWQSCFLLFPIGNAFVATDPFATMVGAPLVMPQYPECYDLLGLTVGAAPGRALELCSGAGAQSVNLSTSCAQVVGVDNASRALAFGAFNAAFNARRNVEFVSGDVAALAACPAVAERFDVVVANPPYNPDPTVPAGENYWSGGPDGMTLVRACCVALPGLLAPGGFAVILTLMPRTDISFRTTISKWVHGCDLQVLVLETATSYESRRGIDVFGGPRDADLRENWRHQGILGFSTGIIVATPAHGEPFVVVGDYGSEREGPRAIDAVEVFERLRSAGPQHRNEVARAMLGVPRTAGPGVVEL